MSLIESSVTVNGIRYEIPPEAAQAIHALVRDIASLRSQLEAANESAAQFARNADFYRGLICQIGNMYEDEARTSDDGSLQDDVLALKVPELVAASLTKIADLTRRIEGSGEPVAWARNDTVFGWSGQLINVASMFPSPKGLKNPIALYTVPPAAAVAAALAKVVQMCDEALIDAESAGDDSDIPIRGIRNATLATPHDTTALREFGLRVLKLRATYVTRGHDLGSSGYEAIVDEIIGGGGGEVP